ncbi:MAG TPA: hypothetical protein PKX56_02190 [Marmoricola sp.]|nr:hypothetical protein [Marmoricola sp.]
MSPLVRIGFGLLIMLLHAPYWPKGAPKWETYDVFADPIGWVFVLLGLWALRRTHEVFQPALYAAAVALVAATVTWVPQINHRLDASAQWFTSLPQVVAIALICRAIAYVAREQVPPVTNIAQRHTVLMWGQVALGILPPILISIDNSQLLIGMLTFAGLLMVATTISMFIDQRNTWLGGPGPRPLPDFKPRR